MAKLSSDLLRVYASKLQHGQAFIRSVEGVPAGNTRKHARAEEPLSAPTKIKKSDRVRNEQTREKQKRAIVPCIMVAGMWQIYFYYICPKSQKFQKTH